MIVSHVVWALRLLVAVVFGWAGFAKLANRAGTRQSVEEFGVPARWCSMVATALPVVELVVAAAVLPSWTATAAGVTALGLLLVLSLLVARLLLRGERPACSCFGATSARPIGAPTLLRNVVLGLLVLAAVLGSLARDDVPQELPFGYAAGTAALAVIGVVQLHQGLALRQLRRRIDVRPPAQAAAKGLPVGVLAPEFDLASTDGGRGSLRSALAAGAPVLLLSLRPGCGPCARIAEELPRWRERLAGKATVLLIGTGDAASVAAWAREHRVGEMLIQQSAEVGKGYRLHGSPAAVLVDTAGRIAAPGAFGTYAIRELLSDAASGRPSP
ncbi:peroxiredoxin family protein [Kribbella antibiotica]|uniref:peroxiredoxin family protein n=1 Tax=Kribbella antibiotica TaxID=190195 RepID=UPI001404FB3F|nr:MauE/DoxX family redox-associated membrane protein [Kribbella antibiotica]